MNLLKLRLNIHAHSSLVLLVLAAAILPFLVLGHASAVSKTWDGGCGADTTWSCANNWSDNIVPGSGDTVNFLSSFTGNSTVDASFAGTVTSVSIGAGYTGTITLNRSFTSSTSFSQAAGTFTAGSQTVQLGSLVLTGGTFNASSGTTSDSGNLTISGSPTFNANGGTFNFNGTGSNTLSCNNVTFNLVTFTHTGGNKTVSSNCSLPLGNNPNANSGGGIVNNGTLSGTGTFTTSGNFTFGVGSTVTGFTGRVATGLIINGTANYSSYTTFTVTAGFILNSGGTFTAPTGIASFGANFTINSGSTFNANGGTVNFNGTSGTLTCNNAIFNLVTFTNTSSTKTVGSDCSLPLGNNPNANSGGSITNNGTLTGTGTFTTGGTFTFGVGSSVTGFTGRVAGGLTINGTANYGSYTTFTVSGTFTVNSGGVFTAPSGTASFAGGFNTNAGSTFNANGGTINFNGTVSSTITCSGAVFNLVTFTHTAGTKTVSSDCNLPLGADPVINNGSITLNGTLSGSGTLTKIIGTLTLNTGYSLSGFTGLDANSNTLVINATNADFSNFTFFRVAIFTVNSGAVFTAPSGTAQFRNNFTISSSATFNANGGTVAFVDGTGTGGTNTLACGNAVFNLVVFNNPTSTKVVGSDCSFPLGANPTLGAGGLKLSGTLSGSGTLTKLYSVDGSGFTLEPGYVLSGFTSLNDLGTLVVDDNTIANFSGFNSVTTGISLGIGVGSTFTAPALLTVGGNFLNSGTFNANGGTVVLNGSGQSIIGNTTFYNLTKTVSSADTLTFTAGDTITVAGLLTLKGGSGGLLSLVSSVPGTEWFLVSQGTTSISYVDVADSDASGGKAVVACNSADSGNNTNWDINPASCYPSSGGTSAPSAITNYVLLQASIARQNAQSQGSTPGSAPSDTNLPSRIYDFIRQFPHKKELVRAAEQFLIALFAGIIIGMLILIFLLWRRRQEQDQEDREDLAAETLAATTLPPATTPPAEPGTTVMPTRPTPPTAPDQTEPVEPTSEVPQDKQDKGGRP